MYHLLMAMHRTGARGAGSIRRLAVTQPGAVGLGGVGLGSGGPGVLGLGTTTQQQLAAMEDLSVALVQLARMGTTLRTARGAGSESARGQAPAVVVGEPKKTSRVAPTTDTTVASGSSSQRQPVVGAVGGSGVADVHEPTPAPDAAMGLAQRGERSGSNASGAGSVSSAPRGDAGSARGGLPSRDTAGASPATLPPSPSPAAVAMVGTGPGSTRVLRLSNASTTTVATAVGGLEAGGGGGGGGLVGGLAALVAKTSFTLPAMPLDTDPVSRVVADATLAMAHLQAVDAAASGGNRSQRHLAGLGNRTGMAPGGGVGFGRRSSLEDVARFAAMRAEVDGILAGAAPRPQRPSVPLLALPAAGVGAPPRRGCLPARCGHHGAAACCGSGCGCGDSLCGARPRCRCGLLPDVTCSQRAFRVCGARMAAWYARWVPGPPAVVRSAALWLVSRSWFDSLFVLIILGNAIALGCEYDGQSPEYARNTALASYVFTLLFAVELVLQLLARGFPGHLNSLWNGFDALVTLASVVDMAIDLAPIPQTGSGIGALRIIRVLRILRVAASWKGIRLVLADLSKALPSAANAVVLLLAFMLVFALLGMQLFGGGYETAVARGAIPDTPRGHFNNLWTGFVTVFQVSAAARRALIRTVCTGLSAMQTCA